MKLEDELRRALARERPPRDFAERVVERINGEKQPSAVVFGFRRRVLALGAAAAVAIGTASSVYYVRQRQAAEAERVRIEAEQLRTDAVTGLRIASAKLNDVYEKLQRISSQHERPR